MTLCIALLPPEGLWEASIATPASLHSPTRVLPPVRAPGGGSPEHQVQRDLAAAHTPTALKRLKERVNRFTTAMNAGVEVTKLGTLLSGKRWLKRDASAGERLFLLTSPTQSLRDNNDCIRVRFCAFIASKTPFVYPLRGSTPSPACVCVRVPVQVRDIVDVLPGLAAPGFAKRGKSAKPAQSFAIITPTNEYDFEALTQDSRDTIVAGLLDMLTLMASETYELPTVRKPRVVKLHDLTNPGVMRVLGGTSASNTFLQPSALCFTPRDTLLVADFDKHCVVELDVLTGACIRSIETRCPTGIACSKDVVVVSNGKQYGFALEVFDAATGALINSFGHFQGETANCVGQTCSGVKITPDGKHVAVLCGHKVVLFELTGRVVRNFALPGGNAGRIGDIAYTMDDEVVVADVKSHRVLVLTPDGGAVRRTFDLSAEAVLEAQLTSPTSLAVRGSHLYVMDSRSDRVCVFE